MSGATAQPSSSSPTKDGDKGKPISKQQLSKWPVKCIRYTYDKNDIPTPDGIKGHQTHKMVFIYADMAGADPLTICEAACWANTCTFAKFANSDAEFGRRVLMLASRLLCPGPTPLGWVSDNPETPFPSVELTISIGRVELNFNQDTFHSGSDTWGNNSIGPYKCARTKRL